MTAPTSQHSPTRALNAAQARRAPTIIAAALTWGVVMFGGVAFFLSSNAQANEPASASTSDGPLVFLVALGAPFVVALSFVLRRLLLAKSLRTGDPQKRMAGFRQAYLIANALSEGVALASAAGVIATHALYPCGVGYVVGLLGLLIQFPTPGAFDDHLAEPASGERP